MNNQPRLLIEPARSATVSGDLHQRVSPIVVVPAEGELPPHRFPNEPRRLEQFFAELPPRTPIAIEATGTWWCLSNLLERLRHQPILSHPTATTTIAAARLKHETVDARRLALLRRGDLHPTVWIPPGRPAESACTRPPPPPRGRVPLHRPPPPAE